MQRHRVQNALGIAATVVVWFGLNSVVPEVSTTLREALIWMTVIAVISFGIGGFVAKKNFLLPTLLLASTVWLATTGYSQYLGASLENPFWQQLFWNLPNLLLIPASAIGATIGMATAAKVQSTSSAKQ